RLAETSRLNTGVFLPDLVDELGAADDDAFAVTDAGRHENVGRVERLRANRTRFEILRLDMTPRDGFSIAAAHQSIANDDEAGGGLAALGGHGDGLADAQRRRRVGYREIQHGGLLLQGPAPALEAELHRDVAAAADRGRMFERRGIVVAI